METLKEKAEAMLQGCEVVVLTSINKEGYPRPVPMSKIKSDGISVIWMATGLNSVKTKDFLANPKAGVCFQEQGNSVALTGEVEIITDNAIKKELWQDWFIEHFTEGATDPNYVLIKFVAQHATYWIDGKFIHRKMR
ncbi:pyridoxamine 5'-phosphate oxidase family protein [Parabacteroides pacaensis]|uniref:pyridoxamine 5'-phosphate oxidase family protein n=1 Tax=Parabacteroides pacaensis TaxID=2086575 RepID=UPI000D0F7F16|nr:pyridoxamine 5'-phosphate oxidase family protein [Parabacteroides pacaensis]